MSLDALALQKALVTHAKALGIFDRVIGHDPKNSPGTGLTASVICSQISARPSTGLSRSSALVVFMVRIMTPLKQNPLDDIDPVMLGATDKLVNSLMGAFTLGGLVRAVDIRGMAGTPLVCNYGHVEIGGTLYRVGDVTIPLICNDVWIEAS